MAWIAAAEEVAKIIHNVDATNGRNTAKTASIAIAW